MTASDVEAQPLFAPRRPPLRRRLMTAIDLHVYARTGHALLVLS